MNVKNPNIITGIVLACTLVLALSLTFMVDTTQPTGTVFPVPESGFNFPYALHSPQQAFLLPNALREISGLAWKGDEQILAVQDEKGFIYVYDLRKKEVAQKVRFGKNQDYEGITQAGNNTYVLKSDGDIFKIDSLSGEKVDGKKYETPLKLSQDTEGLTYDPKGDRLLIALKAAKVGPVGKKDGDKRVIYGFDLKENRLSEQPLFYIDQLELGRLIYQKEKPYTLHPSGIAIHPKKGHMYIIASAGKILVVLNRKGKLLYAERLDPKQFPQPEGIAFAPDGRLFLASEGKGGKGRLLVFQPK